MRPEEACELEWQRVELNGTTGRVGIESGKTAAARRVLPLFPQLYARPGIPCVYAMLQARHAAQGKPSKGYVFPTGSKSGPLEEDSYKGWHAKAFKTLEQARKAKPALAEVKRFEPYVLRHTFLTWLAPHVDPFTLARIAGHSSLRTIQRYAHPQQETVERALDHAAESLALPP